MVQLQLQSLAQTRRQATELTTMRRQITPPKTIPTELELNESAHAGFEHKSWIFKKSPSVRFPSISFPELAGRFHASVEAGPSRLW